MTTPTTLAPELRNLCSRIATERTRPLLAQTAAELRRDVQRTLASGRPANEVQGWLQGLLGEALKGQAHA